MSGDSMDPILANPDPIPMVVERMEVGKSSRM